MHSSRPWLTVSAILLVLALGASSATATTYVRGYVRPSGDGPNDCATNDNCVQLDPQSPLTTSINLNLLGVTSTQTFSYDVLSYSTDPSRLSDGGTLTTIDALSLSSLNLQAGELLTFVFSGSVPSSLFGILACGTDGNATTIFDSIGTFVSSSCTDFPTSSTLITDETDSGSSATFTIASNITFPSQFAFSFPDGVLPTEIDVASAPVSTPEPASLSLLAAGLVGLGVIRRKRIV